MVIQLLVNVEMPDTKVPASAMEQDFKALAADSVKLGFAQCPDIAVVVVPLPAGFERIIDIVAVPMLTKADLTRHYNVCSRTLERYVAEHKIPQPLHVLPGPRWHAEQIAAHEHQ